MHKTRSHKKIDQQLIQKVADLIMKATEENVQLEQSDATFYREDIIQNLQPNINIINRLYQPNLFFKKNEERRLQKLYKQIGQVKPFKVSNKISKQLNKRNPSKPIFQRTPQIIQQRQKRLTAQKIHLQSKDSELEQKSQKKLNFEEFHEKQQQFQRKRSSYLNQRRMQGMNLAYSEVKEKPELNQETEDIVKYTRYSNKPVLDRFQQHNIKKRYHDMMRVKRITESQTPFSPSISKKSRLLASKSFSNLRQSSSVFDRMNRNPSKQCIKRGCLQHLRCHQVNSAFKQYNNQSRSKSKSTLMNSHSNSKYPSKSISKFSKGNLNSISRSKFQNKINFSSSNYSDENGSSQNSNTLNLKRVIYANKKQVVNFVKKLIIRHKILQQS